jgi:hypothetical protein
VGPKDGQAPVERTAELSKSLWPYRPRLVFAGEGEVQLGRLISPSSWPSDVAWAKDQAAAKHLCDRA